jgi:hypothetical protein
MRSIGKFQVHFRRVALLFSQPLSSIFGTPRESSPGMVVENVSEIGILLINVRGV